MKLKFYFFFTFFTFLFLFYPGDSPLFHTFAYNRPLFSQSLQPTHYNLQPIPYLKYFYYPFTSAQGIYVVDLPSFTPILERNIHEKFYPASTTKILTALTAYDLFKPDEVVTIDNDVITEGQLMELIPGEKITVENLLYGTLVHSGNDAAYALAQHYGVEKFVALMNEKAKKLKMTGSYFKNPNGLDDPGQYTTAFDLALAARELLKNSYLKKIVSTKEIIISDVDYTHFHKLTNVNKLLGEIAGIGGLKTGYTEAAGENLISFYKHNGHEYLIVILKSEDRFKDTKNVVKWIEENVDYTKL